MNDEAHREWSSCCWDKIKYTISKCLMRIHTMNSKSIRFQSDHRLNKLENIVTHDTVRWQSITHHLCKCMCKINHKRCEAQQTNVNNNRLRISSVNRFTLVIQFCSINLFQLMHNSNVQRDFQIDSHNVECVSQLNRSYTIYCNAIRVLPKLTNSGRWSAFVEFIYQRLSIRLWVASEPY